MLWVCPTPIGNLRDVTLRVLDVLRSADVVACEDTRHTGLLLKHHGIAPSRLLSFHDYNEQERTEVILSLLRQGQTVALVSDAGMPGLSDPGFGLIRACIAERLPVSVLPGPSAVSTALVLSGFPTDRFAFVGFLARNQRDLIGQLESLAGSGATLIAFESPRRVRKSLQVIAQRWPTRRIALCRELTKMHEEVLRGTAGQVLEGLPEPVRGEIVLVLEADPERDSRGSADSRRDERVRAALAEMLQAGMGVKKASALAAALSGLSARETYRMALALRGEAS